MSSRRRTRAWVAAAAILCHALVPIYAMASAPGGAGGPGTAGGAVSLRTAAGGAGVPARPAERSRRPCPFCLVLATPFTLPAPVAVGEQRALPDGAEYARDGAAAPAKAAPASHRNRGPPLAP